MARVSPITGGVQETRAVPYKARERATVRSLGALFESLVALNLRVYSQASEADVRHLRTQRGEHKVDFIVVGPDDGVVAVEVKLSATVAESDVKHLHWLRERIGDQLLDAVLITTGTEAYRREDGIAVVPAALLGP